MELGLSSTPSQKNYNKEKFVNDIHNFIRRLKLKEYFYERNNEDSQVHAKKDIEKSTGSDRSDRSRLNWTIKNPNWYPAKVREERSESLTQFIDNLLNDIKHHLELNKNNNWNNLTDGQRKALNALSSDDSIIIKPADKGNGIVIMDTNDYNEACLETLNNKNYYEDVSEDPNPNYRRELDGIISEMSNLAYIGETEETRLREGSRTPCFYGLPKMHKSFSKFPPLRPICSGYQSCTARLSEWVDSFLKPAAMKTKSYIRDTTDFVMHIESLNDKEINFNDVFLVTMDVASLYPNISHKEGISACEKALEQRKDKSIPSSYISKLINFILTSNTMQFLNKYYHQIKGTAMGTPMAVNYANLFMSTFEDEMIDAYKKEHGRVPLSWVRYIDDIFFLWNDNIESLNNFLAFCNSYAENHGYQSNIKFTTEYSKTEVAFLDTKIKIVDGKIMTELYCKPTSTHSYLHRQSDHPFHTIRSNPLSQFIRIRRICHLIQDYRKHAIKFINFYVNRGYSISGLNKIAKEVEEKDRTSLLNGQVQNNSPNKDRIPLVINWHRKFKGLAKVLHRNYELMIHGDPNMRNIFSNAPMIAYRRNPNIRSKLVKSDTKQSKSYGESIRCTQKNTKKRGRPCKLCPHMGQTNKLKNEMSGKVSNISGGTCQSKNVIYAAECNKHNTLYVGYTSTPVSQRFNKHRSDSRNDPTATELGRHFFNSQDCTFDKNLKVHILQKVEGNEADLGNFEDKWIARLDTKEPNGMNSAMGELAKTHYKLFPN